MKKIISLVLVMVVILGMIPLFESEAKASTVGGVVERLNSLRSVYPAKKYWNHYVSKASQAGNALKANGDSSTYADSVTDYPCANHKSGLSNDYYVGKYDCNYYYGFQCNGFARRVFYKVFGQNISSGTKYTSGFENIKPGDFIHMTSSDPNGHYAVVLSNNGDTLSIVEANHNENCQIHWDRKIDIERVTHYIRASNYADIDAIQLSSDGYLYLSQDTDTSNASFPGKWIRSTDSTSGELIGSIPYGEYAVVTKYNSAGTWGYVNYKGTVGWTQISDKTFPYQGMYTCPEVVFNANGGSVSTPSKKVYINTPYGELPTPTRTGYTFSGWYTSASGGTKVTDTTNVTLTANQTLYAQWTAKKYTISYNANGGSGAPANQNKTHDIALTLSTTKPTKTGYTFVNWKATNGTTYAAGASYTANAGTTLTAQWKANTYTVSYNANGGSGTPANQNKTHDIALTLSTTKPTRTGYTFKGWATSASGSVAYASGANYTSNSSVTLYAVWEKILVDAQSIVLGEHKTSLEIGETDTVSFSITPANSDWETMYFLYYDSDIVELKWVNNQDAFEVTAKSAGETEIVIELENESGTKIKTSYVINVKLPENSSVMGDVNGDGEVTSLDVIILSRHIAGWTGYETLPYGK